MKAVRRGFIKSIPILCSYLFVGMAYGIYDAECRVFLVRCCNCQYTCVYRGLSICPDIAS